MNIYCDECLTEFSRIPNCLFKKCPIMKKTRTIKIHPEDSHFIQKFLDRGKIEKAEKETSGFDDIEGIDYEIWNVVFPDIICEHLFSLYERDKFLFKLNNFKAVK